MSLDKYRKDINEIDEKLSELFQERLRIIEKIALYKKENNIEIYDKTREEQVVIKALNTLKDEKFSDEIKEFFKSMMDISKEYQKKI